MAAFFCALFVWYRKRSDKNQKQNETKCYEYDDNIERYESIDSVCDTNRYENVDYDNLTDPQLNYDDIIIENNSNVDLEMALGPGRVWTGSGLD
jgi:hypothetical protein